MRALFAAMAVAGFAVAAAPAVAAGPAMCGSHADHGGQAFGNGPGTTYVTACGGDSGPDYQSNATAPQVDMSPQGGVE